MLKQPAVLNFFLNRRSDGIQDPEIFRKHPAKNSPFRMNFRKGEDGRELNGGKRGALDCLPMRHLDPAVHQRRVWLDVYAV
ncbi:MAG: hypothetical protein QXT13_12775, partial [Pyrobaculum sp.]